jgi:hypothetical protein
MAKHTTAKPKGTSAMAMMNIDRCIGHAPNSRPERMGRFSFTQKQRSDCGGPRR